MSGLFDGVADPTPGRVIGWFSCGAPSAVACKLTLTEHPDAEIVRIRIGTEHADSDRYAADCEAWFGKPIVTLAPPDGDHFAVIRRTRFIKGPNGARCTRELKQNTRKAYQRSGDLHVFGFDAEESGRVCDFADNNPDLWFSAPLVDAGLTKSDCKRIIEKAGIRLPAMYELGYANANCVGCVKGGIGYWNRIRKDFPLVFAEMGKIEREIGHSILRHRSGESKGLPMYLDQLDPTAGRFEEDQPGECGVLCQVAMEKVGLGGANANQN